MTYSRVHLFYGRYPTLALEVITCVWVVRNFLVQIAFRQNPPAIEPMPSAFHYGDEVHYARAAYAYSTCGDEQSFNGIKVVNGSEMRTAALSITAETLWGTSNTSSIFSVRISSVRVMW